MSLIWVPLIQCKLPHYTFNIYFNIILSSIPRYSKWSPTLTFPHKYTGCTCPLSHTCHMLRPSLFTWVRWDIAPICELEEWDKQWNISSQRRQCFSRESNHLSPEYNSKDLSVQPFWLLFWKNVLSSSSGQIVYPEDGDSRPLWNYIKHHETALFHDPAEDMNYSNTLNAMLRKVLRTPSREAAALNPHWVAGEVAVVGMCTEWFTARNINL